MEREAGVRGGLHVGVAVADQPGSGKIQIQVPRGPIDHARGRFAAGTGDFQIGALAGITFMRMVRAVVNRIQVGAIGAQNGFELIVNLLKLRLGAFASGQHGLVGHDHRSDAGAVQSPDGRAASGKTSSSPGVLT